MAESNEQPPLCPCGFWGSAMTSGLCSKCYKEYVQKEELATNKPDSVNTSSDNAAAVKQSEKVAEDSSAASTTENLKNDAIEKKDNDVSRQTASPIAMATDTTSATAALAEKETEVAKATESNGAAATEAAEAAVSRPVQKNKKRCFKCNQRLELAFTEIGRCKCEYVFCMQHRLPEQHDCHYDHKEMGRKEALDKMVSPRKHVGTSLRRLDSDH